MGGRSQTQATYYPPALMPPFMGAHPPTKLGGGTHGGASVNYFQDYRNEAISRFTMPPYEWGLQKTPYSPRPDLVAASKIRDHDRSVKMPPQNITTVDQGRLQEVDDIFKAVQVQREQYKDDTGKLHPLVFFKGYQYKYQCAPGMTSSYFTKYPHRFTEYKVPPVLPLTYERRTRTPYIPDLCLAGVHSPSGCIAYKR